MPSLKELFKTKPLPTQNGKVGAEVYDIRNSKDIPITTANGILNGTVFPIIQKTLRSSELLTARTKENLVESELVGLRAIRGLSSPVIYGTDIIRLKRRTTNILDAMKNAANGGNETDNGIIGNFINKVKDKALEVTSKLGIAFPETMIPTRISLNDKFKSGLEPDTMTTLAEIKKDAAGTLLGQFLAKNAKGTPNQIGRQAIGAGIDVLKSKVRKKLFGSPLVGGQNLANKSVQEVQYDSVSYYSNTVFPQTDNISVRNDLSSILSERTTLLQSIKVGGDGSQKITEGVSNLTNSTPNELPTLTDSQFGNIQSKIKSITIKTRSDLAGGRKAGQREIAKTENINDNFQYKDNVKYSGTVDEDADDIKLRNDLSTKLEALNAAIAVLSFGRTVDRTSTKYSQAEFNEKTLAERNWETKSDFINSKPPYSGDTLILSNREELDGYDFIPVKFTSVLGGRSVNFTAVLDGINETVSPTWDSAKFLGSPFSYYTYTGVERTVSFNLKLFSLNPAEHVIMWQKIDFLTSLTYPISYNGDPGYIVPPFLKFTMGNLYKNKECFISSLSYAMEDNGGWELGTPILGDSKINVAGESVNLNEYKLPKLVSVSITLTFVESRGNTETQKYGYGKKIFSTQNITNIS
jgi:hypothetical protein